MTLVPVADRPVPELVPSQTARTVRWEWAVAALTVTALGLRVLALDRHSFWYDEAYTARMVSHPSFTDILRGVVRDDGNPPLYWLLARAWASLFGRSEIALRSLSVLCSVLTVPLLARLGRRLFSPAVGLLAAGLLAISPLAVELANEARTYALQQLLTVGSTLLFVRWVDRRGLWDLALYAVATFLACFSHYYVFVVPVAHAAGLLALPRGRHRLAPWLAAMAVAAVLWLPWLPAFLAQVGTPGNLGRANDRWPIQFLATPVVFSLGRSFAWRDSAPAMLGLALVGSLVGWWLPALATVARAQRPRFPRALLGTWLLLPILGPLLVALAGTPLYHAWAGSVGLPAFLLLAAAGLEPLRWSLRRGVIGMVLALTAVSLCRYVALPLKDDWRAVVPFVLAHAREGEPVVFDPGFQVDSFKYYVPRFGQMPAEMVALSAPEAGPRRLAGLRYQDGERTDRDPSDYTERICSAPGVWLILCAPYVAHEQYDALLREQGYVAASSFQLQRLRVYHFTKRLTAPG
jgi:4-amino-4-deoxy-L-arabinose transferase-like glycosyltransferase